MCRVVVCAGLCPLSISALTAASTHATQALSSKCRERIKPFTTSTRGSRYTKSPTAIPSALVSAALVVRASTRTSNVPASRFVSFTAPPCTCDDALLSCTLPRTLPCPSVATVTPSPSIAFHAYPPICDNASRPFGLISLTIAPSVSTCAVTARGSASDTPASVAKSAPLRVRRVSIPNSRRARSVYATAASVSPVGLGVFRRPTRRSVK